jgi:hypothetical protein
MSEFDRGTEQSTAAQQTAAEPEVLPVAGDIGEPYHPETIVVSKPEEVDPVHGPKGDCGFHDHLCGAGVSSSIGIDGEHPADR